MQPSPPFPDLAKWQADAVRRRKHISSWGWEGREGQDLRRLHLEPETRFQETGFRFQNDNPPCPDTAKWQDEAALSPLSRSG